MSNEDWATMTTRGWGNDDRVTMTIGQKHMAKTFTLGKEQRLKSRKLIERIFREGKSFSQYPFRVTYILSAAGTAGRTDGAPMGLEGMQAGPGCENIVERAKGGVKGEKKGGKPPVHLQAGFGASSRNFKKAVDRNRIKRLTREAYRLQQQALSDRLVKKGKRLMVFFIYTGKELPVYTTVVEKIAVILQKLNKELGA